MNNYFNALNVLFDSYNKTNINNSTELIPLLNSLNRIVSKDIIATNNIPLFNNAAMDGYAINMQNLITINNKNVFFIIDTIVAGEYSEFDKLDNTFIIEIMTGARLPSVFNSVIKYEDIYIKKINKTTLIINRCIKLSENIRLIGEDFILTDIIINKGDVISPSHLLILSSFGIKSLDVVTNPKIYLLCTGNELIDSTTNNLSNKNSLIYDTTSVYIINFFKLLGIDVCFLGSVNDSINIFLNKLNPILNTNFNSLIISTGAVSKGVSDFIPKALSEIGVKLLFHGVKIKPGKPILCGKYKKNNYFFGLPGNPISSIIGIRFFIYPFLRHMLGLQQEKPKKASLISDYNSVRNADSFLKTYSFIKNGNFYTKILSSQESFKIGSMIESNSFAFIKKNETTYKNDLIHIFFNNPTLY